MNNWEKLQNEFYNLKELLRLIYNYKKTAINKFEYIIDHNKIKLHLSLYDVEYGEIYEDLENIVIHRDIISSIKDIMQYYKYRILEQMLEYHIGKNTNYKNKISKLNKDIEELNIVSDSKVLGETIQKEIDTKKHLVKHNQKILRKLEYFNRLDGNWKDIPITKEDIRCYQFRMITPDIEKYITHEDKDDEIFEPLM